MTGLIYLRMYVYNLYIIIIRSTSAILPHTENEFSAMLYHITHNNTNILASVYTERI